MFAGDQFTVRPHHSNALPLVQKIIQDDKPSTADGGLGDKMRMPSFAAGGRGGLENPCCKNNRPRASNPLPYLDQSLQVRSLIQEQQSEATPTPIKPTDQVVDLRKQKAYDNKLVSGLSINNLFEFQTFEQLRMRTLKPMQSLIPTDTCMPSKQLPMPVSFPSPAAAVVPTTSAAPADSEGESEEDSECDGDSGSSSSYNFKLQNNEDQDHDDCDQAK